MNKTTLIASVAVAGVAIRVAYKLSTEMLVLQVAERFPDIDVNVVRTAYRQFLKNARAGKYGPMDDLNDYQMDQLFLAIVNENPLRKR
jgi:hypothetical protein